MLTIAPELNAIPSDADTGVSPPVQSGSLVKYSLLIYHLQNDHRLQLLPRYYLLLEVLFYSMINMHGTQKVGNSDVQHRI